MWSLALPIILILYSRVAYYVTWNFESQLMTVSRWLSDHDSMEIWSHGRQAIWTQGSNQPRLGRKRPQKHLLSPGNTNDDASRGVDQCACSVKTMFVAMNWGFCSYNVKYIHMWKEQTSRGCGSLVRRWVLITLSISRLRRWPNVPKRKSKNSPCSVKSMSGKDSSSLPPPAPPLFFVFPATWKAASQLGPGRVHPERFFWCAAAAATPPPLSRGSDLCPRCCRCRDNPAWPFVSM